MTRALLDRSARRVLILGLGLMAISATASPAQAQWGFGYGPFWGYNPVNSSRTVDAINERSLIRGQQAMANRETIQPQPNGPNSYMNNLRDPGYVDRYDISTRRGVSSNVARSFTPTPAPATNSPPPRQEAPAPRPTIALASFFNAANKVIWPADAPVSGGLGAKRDQSDEASLQVLQESRARGSASVASVTEARNLLLDYGRPALERLRETTTPAVSDSFHRFLLGLYEALAQAGQPPKTPPSPRLP